MGGISGFSPGGSSTPPVTSAAWIPSNTDITPITLDGTDFIALSGENRQLTYICSTGGAVTNTVDPQIESGVVDGQEILLVGVSNIDTIRLKDGNGLFLNGDCVMRNGSTLVLFWNDLGGLWMEISRNDK